MAVDTHSLLFEFRTRLTPKRWYSLSPGGRASSRGALAPEPPRATRSQPELIRTGEKNVCNFFSLQVFGLSLDSKKVRRKKNRGCKGEPGEYWLNTENGLSRLNQLYEQKKVFSTPLSIIFSTPLSRTTWFTFASGAFRRWERTRPPKLLQKRMRLKNEGLGLSLE